MDALTPNERQSNEHSYEEAIDAFRERWNEKDLPELSSFVSQHGPFPRNLLAELARVDQEERASRQLPNSVEAYLTAFPLLAEDEEQVLDLVYHEYLLRRRAGLEPDFEEYERRFPHLATRLAMQVELGKACDNSQPGGDADTTPQYPSVGRLPFETLPASLGRYRIESLLGRGAMGTVWRAWDTVLERTVALKIPSHSLHGDNLQRFQREARLAGRLSHPGLCPVLDFGVIEDVTFYTMPLIPGEPLSALIRRRELGSVPDRVKLVRDLARSISVAHAQGILHRDLKSANVMARPDGSYVVMDFGLARSDGNDASHSSSEGMLVGTPLYMAPELFRGDPPSKSSDVYSLAVILYELLSGLPPFTGSLPSLMTKVMLDPPPPLHPYVTGIDERLESILRRGLAKSTNERISSMEDFAATMDKWLEQQPAQTSSATDASHLTPNRSAFILRAVMIGGLLMTASIIALLMWQGSHRFNRDRAAELPKTEESILEDPLTDGSRWTGGFEFLPPIEGYKADAELEIVTRDDADISAIYSTEQGQYQWRLKGKVRETRIQLEFVERLRGDSSEELIGNTTLEGERDGDRLHLIYRESISGDTAKVELQRAKNDL